MTPTEQNAMKYVRLRETYETLQQAHLVVVQNLSDASATIARLTAERDALRAAATEAVNWLARINEAYGSGIIGRGEVERLRTALAQTDTRP